MLKAKTYTVVIERQCKDNFKKGVNKNRQGFEKIERDMFNGSLFYEKYSL